MPEVIFTGPAGRLEGRYHQQDNRNAPIALVLHPHPQYGGTMNNKVVYNVYQTFVDRTSCSSSRSANSTDCSNSPRVLAMGFRCKNYGEGQIHLELVSQRRTCVNPTEDQRSAAVIRGESGTLAASPIRNGARGREPGFIPRRPCARGPEEPPP